MTPPSLLQEALAQTEYQLTKVLEGLGEDDFSFRVSPHAMTPLETVWHLTEVCVAYISEVQGEKYAWGSYKPASTSIGEAIEELFAIRSQAVAVALTDNKTDSGKRAFEYLVTHEAYHVGQLCLARIELDRNWDAYSIYKK